jgi:nucleotidyltransferase substrate binding protein (TIGR01987 family)
MKKLKLEILKLEKSLINLENTQLINSDKNLYPIYDTYMIDACIKRFELTFDLLWKTLRVFFYYKGIELHYPKDVLKEAYLTDYLEDELLWLRMLQDYNISAYSYDETLASDLFKRIKIYIPFMRNSFNKIAKTIKEIQYDA